MSPLVVHTACVGSSLHCTDLLTIATPLGMPDSASARSFSSTTSDGCTRTMVAVSVTMSQLPPVTPLNHAS